MTADQLHAIVNTLAIFAAFGAIALAAYWMCRDDA